MMLLEDEIKRSCQVLQQGGVILYPTDTVWGIGCDACNRDAVARIYKIKQREDSKSMLALIDSPTQLYRYVAEAPDIALDLMAVSDRPLTIIYSNARNVAPNLLAADGSLGIRVTTEPFSQALCRSLKRPVVSTSANISGQPAPTIFSEISETIRQAVDYIVDYRRNDTTKSHPSSIIKLENNGIIKIIRP